MRVFIYLGMLVIIIAMVTSFVYLVCDNKHNMRTVKALSWRISAAFALFIFLLLAYSFGWIQPHPL